MVDDITYKNIFGSQINVNGKPLETEATINFPKKIPKAYHSPEQELKNLVRSGYLEVVEKEIKKEDKSDKEANTKDSKDKAV